MPIKKLLSDAFVSSLDNTPKSPRVLVYDSRIPGLCVEVSSTHKRFVIRSRSRSKTLGRWPIVTTQEARIAALVFLREMEQGCPALQWSGFATHPAAARKEAVPDIPGASKGLTLRAVLLEYTTVKRIKPRTARDYRDYLKRYWSDYLDKPLEALTAGAFLERFRSISAPSGANYSLRIIRALFRFHNAAHDDTLPIPTAKTLALEGAHILRPKSRLILDSQQQPWYLNVCANAGPTGRDFFIFLACTGLRLGEALSLIWNDIDLESCIITIRETKNGVPHVLPLGVRMAALLENRKKLYGDASRAVFPSNPRNVRKSVAKTTAGAVPWSCHDLRRGFASLATRLNIADRIVKRLVNHIESDVTGKHYIHLSPDALRVPMQLIEDAFWLQWEHPPEQATAKEVSNVA